MPSPLDIRLDLPCQVPWDEMAGDDRVRFCTQCNLHVHNLSAMPEHEAAAFLAMRTGRVCVAYQHRADGTTVFADPTPAGTSRSLPVISYETPPQRRHPWLVPLAIAGAVATAGAAAALRTSGPPPVTTTLGAMVSSPVPGGVLPPPLERFDPRSISDPLTCGVAEVQRIRMQLQHDEMGKALLSTLPDGMEILAARYSVYPNGSAPTYGHAYVIGPPGASPDVPVNVRAVVWLLPRGTKPTNSADGESRALSHAATLSRFELFIDADDETLAAATRQALVEKLTH